MPGALGRKGEPWDMSGAPRRKGEPLVHVRSQQKRSENVFGVIAQTW
jgi:hypothetical protein